MTKSTTNIPILDDDEVAEIEARADAASKGDWTSRGASWWDGGVQLAGYGIRFDGFPETYTGWDARTNFPPETPEGKQASADRSFFAHARADIPALCNTVRALKAENQRVYTPSICEALQLLNDAGYGKEVPNSLSEMIKKALAERNDLQSQLEQVTKERDDFKRRLKEWEL